MLSGIEGHLKGHLKFKTNNNAGVFARLQRVLCFLSDRL